MVCQTPDPVSAGQRPTPATPDVHAHAKHCEPGQTARPEQHLAADRWPMLMWRAFDEFSGALIRSGRRARGATDPHAASTRGARVSSIDQLAERHAAPPSATSSSTSPADCVEAQVRRRPAAAPSAARTPESVPPTVRRAPRRSTADRPPEQLALPSARSPAAIAVRISRAADGAPVERERRHDHDSNPSAPAELGERLGRAAPLEPERGIGGHEEAREVDPRADPLDEDVVGRAGAGPRRSAGRR